MRQKYLNGMKQGILQEFQLKEAEGKRQSQKKTTDEIIMKETEAPAVMR
jgi:hypothetical protein